ncbi:GspH/FimT family pseudopilin [Acinetobacter sp. S40]|uniref:GspH/FimT family pseudopilin n=1 Tax=unclassified Acinetobacter TaxID=196816 RepID=UPI001909F1E0|nr:MULTISPECIES: GspH/FimT family pseudopilin [unclassified Acinetobacter]MBJ9986266.1 GspH/FimT family pseudopilin [Acinetobacter sp. S40]MBK0064331.1 GspH/FimT family pseudopilin [Acinetobacter sp. S55]MBK0067862.1 GspH/FimT family pseudopilin [Acinetobacter sp. S54]
MKKINDGFSLIEISVVLTIIAVIASFAIPSYHQYMASQEAKKVPQMLTRHIQKAKHESLLYRKNIILCATSTFHECDNNWTNGYILFIDQNKNRNYDLDETVLAIESLQLKYGTLSWQGFGNKRIIFEGNSGLPLASNGSFRYCSHHYPHYLKLTLSRMGHARNESLTSC